MHIQKTEGPQVLRPVAGIASFCNLITDKHFNTPFHKRQVLLQTFVNAYYMPVLILYYFFPLRFRITYSVTTSTAIVTGNATIAGPS